MESVGSFQARATLATLLERVSRGETIIITRHGKPVARLVPERTEATMSVPDAISGLLEFRKTHRIKRTDLSALIDEDREY